ncbi:hydantoinase B/oxoprolinase family protein [Acidisphaera sp. L21]|uniref:hydantoinase B/oxoprolinase family protein n=1 Tax=Acidisphaera sp. L21 TaxID=1641851 RepID=UPI00131EBAC7|nr:hydantoinase B/oxoprolinase family protein [Acidisphaera sp. L21]
MLDAVTIEIMWTRIVSIVDEAAKVIARTAFSTLSNDANDYACVLTDADGASLAQNTYGIPSFIATLPATVRHVLAEFGAASMQDGDIYMTNDPWLGTGHLPDVCLVKPLFHAGQLVAFAATTSHVPDIGGQVRSIAPREIYEEGLHIPPVLFLRGGMPDALLVKLIRLNVRTPDQTMGDVWAQVAALEVMEARLRQLMTDYALTSLSTLANEIYDRSERAMRTAIRTVPEGVYHYEMQTDGMAGAGMVSPFTLRVALTVKDGRIDADYTGTTAQQPCAINCPLTYTYAMTAYAVRCALLPDLPNNEGMFRPVGVHAPEKTLLNPIFPAAVGGRAATGHYVPVLVFGALHQALPGKVMAAPGSPLWNMTLIGEDQGRRYACVLFFNGGLGGRAASDGVSCLSWPSNISTTPVEVAERAAPVLIRYKRLTPGSGGDGTHRGGLGQEALVELRGAAGSSAFFMTERTSIAAPGLGGGDAGGLGAVIIDGVAADTRRPHHLQQGSTVLIRTPGGGGYGPVAARDPALRERDRAQDYVSVG